MPAMVTTSFPRVMGIDPDSKTTAWAIVEGSTAKAVGVYHIKAENVCEALKRLYPALEHSLELHKPELVVVEGQRDYKKVPIQDIIKIAQIAGGIAGQIVGILPSCKIQIVDPEIWKGQTPKPINQTRTYAYFGMLSSMASTYAYPTGCRVYASIQGAAKLNKGDWKHVGDALGLARYGSERLS